MKKTRSLLLCGALAVVFGLTGCGATLGGLVDSGKKWTAKLTGSDDPNNTGLLATAGRMQNNNTDTLAGAVGVKTEVATPAPEVLVAPTPVAVAAPDPAPASVVATAPAPDPAASAAKKPMAKKAPKPMVKSVSTAPPKK